MKRCMFLSGHGTRCMSFGKMTLAIVLMFFSIQFFGNETAQGQLLNNATPSDLFDVVVKKSNSDPSSLFVKWYPPETTARFIVKYENKQTGEVKTTSIIEGHETYLTDIDIYARYDITVIPVNDKNELVESVTPVSQETWKGDAQKDVRNLLTSQINNNATTAALLDISLRTLDSNNFPFIFTTVSVDTGAMPVGGLTNANFKAYENNVLQTNFFNVTPPKSSGGVRLLDFIFIIDNSGSMQDEQQAVKDNVKAFVDSLQARNIDVRLGAVRFGQYANNGYPILMNNGNMTGDVNFFKSLIDQMTASGGVEPGIEAVYQSATSFSFRPGSQRHFLLITDEDSDDGDLIQAANACLSNGITVHTAVDCNYGTAYNDYCSSNSIRGRTNGLQFDVVGPYDAILDRISNSVSNSYIVRYRTSNDQLDGVRREVKIEVNAFGQSDFVIGYYTPGAAPKIVRTQSTANLSNVAQTAGIPITIQAKITDDVAPYVLKALLYYRQTGSATFSSIEMFNIGNNIYSATIPASQIANPAIDYYITATDGSVTSSNPSVDPDILPHQIAVLPNSPPSITHTPVSSSPVGQAIPITALITDYTNYLTGATLYYREFGTLIFKTINMGYIGSNEYRATIPARDMTTAGIEYYIRATDNFGLSSTHGVHRILPPLASCQRSYSNDFEAGDVTGFRPLTPSSWAVQPTGTGNKTYCITNANLNGDEYSTIPGEPWTDFTLSLSAKAGGANNKNFFILFGVPDFNNATRNGYYLQFAFGGIKLYRTINDVGSLIGSHPMNLMSEDIFHDIKVERNGSNIKVIAKNQVVIDINDNYFPSGYIGFGSYKNTACFDALSINGGGASSGLFNDNFEDGVADGWTPLTPSRWSVTLENGSMRYFLNTTNYNSPDGSRPGEYSLIDNSDYGDFTFECLAKSADAAIGSTFPDLGIVFGYQDDKNFYFAMFNGQATETSIDRYVNGVRTRLVMYNNPTFSDGNYHSLRVEREGTIIKTYFDGTLILTADDGTFRSGKIGVGSFNDSGYFDDITISTCESPVIAPLTNISLPPNSQIPAGSILSIPITISTDKLIGVAQFTVDYLSTVINFVSASIGPDAPGFTISQINTTPTFPPVTGGTDRNVIVQMNGGATGTFTGEKKVIMYLNFQAVGTPGSKSVLAINPECNKTFLSTTDFIDICGSDISFEKGSVTIVSGTEVSGTVSYYNSQPVSDAIINLSGPASKKDTTDTSGQYRIVDFPSGTYNLYAEKTGDRRSAISGSDALAVLQAAGFARTLTPDQIIAADVNESGDVTGADAVAILRYLAFLNTGTANVGTWKFIPGSLSITIFGKQQQDYTAYLLGDVTGNWGITNSAGVAKQTVSADILTGKAYIQDGLLRVPLQLSSDGDAVYSGRIRIDWNFEDASGVDFVPSNKDIHFAINSQKAGMTHIAFVSLEGLKAGETIGELTTRFSNVKSNKNNVLGEVAYSELNDVEKPAKQQIFLDKATSNIPEDITLLPNYPNPFNLGTTIRFGIPESTEPVNTQLTIYSIDGKVIRTLVNEELRAGYHSRVWNGLDQSGKTVSSGVYIYLLKSGTKQASAKLLIVK